MSRCFRLSLINFCYRTASVAKVTTSSAESTKSYHTRFNVSFFLGPRAERAAGNYTIHRNVEFHVKTIRRQNVLVTESEEKMCMIEMYAAARAAVKLSGELFLISSEQFPFGLNVIYQAQSYREAYCQIRVKLCWLLTLEMKFFAFK